MSDVTCDCAWCKKQVTTEEAKAKRAEFLVKVFELMFSELFTSSKETVSKAVSEFEAAVEVFLSSSVGHGQVLRVSIVDSCFHAIGLDGDLTPYDICNKCDDIISAIENALRALKVDINLEETPILMNWLTPEIFVNNELKKKEFPKELLDLYINASKEKFFKTILENVENYEMAGLMNEGVTTVH